MQWPAVLKEGLEDKGFIEEKTEGIADCGRKVDLLQNEEGPEAFPSN